MKKYINNLLLLLSGSHLQEKNKTYITHLGEAWYLSYNMFIGFMCLFIHGLVPRLFTNTGSNIIKKLNNYIVNSNLELLKN